MKRYMKLEGVLPSLVSNPWGLDPLGYVGVKRKSWEYGKAPSSPGDRYEPLARVYEYHPMLVKAVANGSLKQIGQAFKADSLADAMKAGAPPPPKKELK